jgi:hypothetical protein
MDAGGKEQGVEAGIGVCCELDKLLVGEHEQFEWGVGYFLDVL